MQEGIILIKELLSPNIRFIGYESWMVQYTLSNEFMALA